MTVDIARLGRRPGAMFELHDTVHSPARIGLELIAIDQGALLDLDLRVESVSEGVLVTGTVAAPTVGECARCLSPVRGRVQVALTELFAYPDSATDETTEEDEVGPSSTKPSISSSRSSMRSVWNCRFRRCAGRTARVFARSAVSRWPASQVIAMNRSTRGGRSWSKCSGRSPTHYEVSDDPVTTTPARRTRCGPPGRAALTGVDPPQLRLRERRAADQRAFGVSRRCRARADHHRRAVPSSS
ncbi:hypothetical protein J113_20300 [Mycobacterium tuberculosis CAS/NITR204]|uniref:DUF177 domain-containing protein n=1 Tax=Mycobacterium tuberculosis CAS/NITR204 TaxID=1310114 RepID=R4MBW3_MYCTX|nr:hypothetical protein J113_20300 [Mycobacterium tuberculosis CAS/NITR204]